MRDHRPNNDWKRCVECGKFTDTLSEDCSNCGAPDTEWVGGWVSDYYRDGGVFA